MTGSGPDHLPDATPATGAERPVAVRLVQSLERAGALDQLSLPIGWLSRVTERPGLRGALTGTALGHAVHPAMTDVPIGLWSSSLLLDVLGREEDRPASRRLLAAGLLTAVPTVLTGLAEWRGTAKPETRIASAHAALNVVAVALYAGSLATRRRAHGRSVALSFAATSVATVAGLLGGHLSAARKTGSRHPSFATDGVGPRLSR
ncbi:DUF2231 domain-containing protein [Nostocoides sp. HKS02]|uniref:DUF2231 domain-containing protein n=1 Tax=Nostocoides sp. HKS02 TaxID=1813880 RepID=UPI0012B4DF15|nr:DUF2231 domain-containing protein [Tetrasphaera sp. HKS02]QGN57396.1 DUF2231 domain-containing protein [Tetrasphaera sp. HKS02]